VVDLWYVIGTVIIPGLLIPVLGIYLKPLRLPASRVFSYMLMCSGVSLCWLILGTIYATEPGAYAYMGIEPFYPGLFLSLALFTLYKVLEKRVEPSVSA
jgi:SSS family solute:Na+ symporter